MNVKSRVPSEDFVDPDDAPELDDEFFKGGEWRIGDRIASREEVQTAIRQRLKAQVNNAKLVATTVKLEADVLAALESTGEGWQMLMNDVLKQWLASRQ